MKKIFTTSQGNCIAALVRVPSVFLTTLLFSPPNSMLMKGILLFVFQLLLLGGRVYGQCYYADIPGGSLTATAATYLCTQGILEDDFYANPNDILNRAEGAAMLYRGNNADATPYVTSTVKNYPTPVVDLNDASIWYYDEAKTMLYLDYNDGQTPFTMEYLQFNPSKAVSRAEWCRALVEAWNIPLVTSTVGAFFSDVPTTHPYYAYILTAHAKGFTDITSGSFLPDNNTIRGDAFIMLHKLMTNPTIPMPIISDASFWKPANLLPENWLTAKTEQGGNFGYRETKAFAIDDIGINLDFSTYYNSVLDQMPRELQGLIKPLGKCWSHTYNMYAMEINGDPIQEPGIKRVALFLGDGNVILYRLQGTSYIPITKGVYGSLTKTDSLTFTLTTKNKVTYSLAKPIGSISGHPFMLKTVKDRNNNTLTVNYALGSTAGIYRIASVKAKSNRMLTFAYHAGTDLIKDITDPIGRKIEFLYQTLNYNIAEMPKLIQYRDAKGQFTHYNYGTGEQKYLINTIQLPKGNVITSNYSDRKLQSVQTNNNNVRQFAYTQAFGSINNSTTTVAVTQDGKTVTTNYNSNGYPTYIDGLGTTSNITYNTTSPWLPASITTNGIPAYPQYDSNGNLLSLTMPMNVVHTYTYNANNDILTYTNPLNQTTTWGYNAAGNLTTITTPLGNITSFTVNANGQVISINNPENIKTSLGYNTNGNLASVTIPLSIKTLFGYDAVSRMTSTTNPLNKVSNFTYDPNDNIITIANSLGNTSTYSYDANDNNVSITNANGFSTNLNYQTDTDWLLSSTFQGMTDAYQYHNDGKISSYTDPSGTVFNYAYDSENRLISNGQITNIAYNANGTIASIAGANGTISYTYDALLRPINSTDIYGNIVAYQWNAASRLIGITYPGNKQVNYTYDNDGRLTQLSTWTGQVITYEWYKDNRLKQKNYGNGTKVVYLYDAAGRNTGIQNRKSDNVILCSNTFTLDKMGYHTAEVLNDPSNYHNALNNTLNYSYNNANQIQTAGATTFSFNADGNTSTKTGLSYSWNNFNELIGVSGTGYNATNEYDVLGRRTARTLNGVYTRYVWSALGKTAILMETNATNNAQNYYIYGIGLEMRIKPDNSPHYYHYDHRGSTIAMTNSSQTMTHQYAYLPFGELTNSVEADYNPFKFVGQHGVMHEALNHYQMGARQYDATIGRFIAKDPIWASNLYTYAGNNPINMIDPSGGKFVSPLEIAISGSIIILSKDNRMHMYLGISNMVTAGKSLLSGNVKNWMIYTDMGAAHFAEVGVSLANDLPPDLLLGKVLPKIPSIKVAGKGRYLNIDGRTRLAKKINQIANEIKDNLITNSFEFTNEVFAPNYSKLAIPNKPVELGVIPIITINGTQYRPDCIEYPINSFIQNIYPFVNHCKKLQTY